MGAKFIAEEGILRGLVLNLEGRDQWVIGKDPNACSLIVEDPSAAKRHLVVRTSSDGIVAENLSQENPIRINDEEIHEPRLLHDGDAVQIGNGVYRFIADGQKTEKSRNVNESEEKKSSPASDEEESAPASDEEESAPASDEEESAPASDEEEDESNSIFDEEEDDEDQLLAEINFDSIDTGRWLLKAIGGPNNGADFTMKSGNGYVLGSDPSVSDIVFNDSSVSRKHVKISITEDDNLYLEDLGSKNGTLIDGNKIEEKTELEIGTLVSIGTSTFAIFDREGDMKTIISPLLPQIVKVLQNEEEKNRKEDGEELEMPQAREATWEPSRHLLLIGIAIAAFAILGIGVVSLFRTAPIEEKQIANTEHKLQLALADFPAVRYSYNKNTGTLFLLGHVKTKTDKTQLMYNLQGLDFIKRIDENNIVIDEYVWQEANLVLNRNPKWKGVNITSPEAGKFILSGYLKTREEAEELSDYIASNFDYLDHLDKRIVVEEDILNSVHATLRNHDMPNIEVSLTDGELTLRGALSPGKAKELKTLLPSFRSITGVRSLRTFISEVTRDTSLIDLTSRYHVSGFSNEGGLNTHVIINGKIVAVGDSIDGMKITSIRSNAVFLERDGVRYRINIQ